MPKEWDNMTTVTNQHTETIHMEVVVAMTKVMVMIHNHHMAQNNHHMAQNNHHMTKNPHMTKNHHITKNQAIVTAVKALPVIIVTTKLKIKNMNVEQVQLKASLSAQ